MQPFRRVKDRRNRLARYRAIAGILLQVPGGGVEQISVSTKPFWEMNICTNTPNCSLFDAQKTAEIDWRVLEQLGVFCCSYKEMALGISL